MLFSASTPLGCAIEQAPDEILSFIFSVAADLPLARRAPPVPLAISAVSRRWRAVVLSSPEVWTTIRVSGRRSREHATLFLQRSTPLEFRLSVDTENSNGAEEIQNICSMLSPHIERCAALALCVSDDELQLWNLAFGEQNKLRRIQTLNLAIHSYPPDELWGPPDSLYDFTAHCTALRSLRLSMAPAMHLDALRLTTLNVRCTWDGAFVRHVCTHSRVLEDLMLRNYSASVFDGAIPTCMPSLRYLALEYSDGAVAEGLVNLERFVRLPGLESLAISWPRKFPATANLHPYQNLRTLRLANLTLERYIDRAVLRCLGANIVHLQLIDVRINTNTTTRPHSHPSMGTFSLEDFMVLPKYSLDVSDVAADYPHLRLLELGPFGRVLLDTVLPVRRITRAQDTPGEVGFFESDANLGEDSPDYNVDPDFERKEPPHACDDFCLAHDQGPWRDTGPVQIYLFMPPAPLAKIFWETESGCLYARGIVLQVYRFKLL
ncbi:hypothetical protein C8R43DRAFT_1105948 [Mycena crocata]|nr:hypothetical protein C8R43DRAFT_1105948 [Mycena crocata]